MVRSILVATRKGLFTVTAGPAGWQLGSPAFLGDPVTIALPDPRDSALYAALNLGHFGVKLRRSRDAGRTWQDIGVPAYPDPDKLALIWSLAAGGPAEPGVLWAGTIPGGLFRSADHGDSWQLVTGLWNRPERAEWFGGGYDHPGIHSILVDPRDCADIILGISCGGVWRTRDGGASWALCATGMRAAFMPPQQAFNPNIQDPHRIVRCATAPDVLWAQHHNGIFRSTDNAATWTEITTAPRSSFGFAVAVHPADPDIAWFVPAVKDECRVPVDGEFVVTRTRDGGRSFEILRSGLPPARAYDLVYRHGLDVDASGHSLALGSTTGGLWVSSDAGQSWQCVSTHLPPISAVQFL
jgi:photosystem II stability/assembly factor-like uncharacterized protein